MPKKINLPSRGHLHQSKRNAKASAILADSSRDCLTMAETQALYEYANRLTADMDRRWYTIGRIVALLIKANPGAAAKRRKEEFNAKLNLGYFRAMRAARLARFYEDSPEEVDIYQPTAADLLRRYATREKRMAVWEATGSAPKLRVYLAKEKREKTSTAPKTKPVKIKRGPTTQCPADGLEVRHDGRFIKLLVDTKRFPRAPKSLESLQAKLAGFPVIFQS